MENNKLSNELHAVELIVQW